MPIIRYKTKEIYLFTNSIGEAVDSGLIDFFICLLCQYWEALGLPLPLMAVYILFLLTWHFFYSLDQDVLVNSYSP